MRPHTPSDRLLVTALAAVWAVCFGLTVRDLWRGTGTPPVFVAAPTTLGGDPTVLGFVPGPRGAAAGLAPGDALVRFGSRDLAGVGPIAFRGIVAEETTPGRPVRVRYVRGGSVGATVLRAGSLRLDWPLVPTSLAFAAVALLLFLRAPPSEVVRAYVVASMVGAITLVSLFGADTAEVTASFVVTLVAASLVGPLVVRAGLHFVGKAGSRAARFGPWVFVLGGIPHVGRIFATPISPDLANVLVFVASVAWGGTTLFLVTRSYRELEDVPRRRLQWIVLGLYAGFVPTMIAAAVTAVRPSFLWLYEDALSGFIVLPLFVAVAVWRHNLFDVERLISATLSYSVLVTCGVAIGLSVVPVLADAAENVLGLDAATSYGLLGLALASVVVPVGRRISGWLHAKFFPESGALASGVYEFLRELSRCDTFAELARVSGTHLSTVLRPRVCAIFARSDGKLVSAFVRGPAAPSAIPCESHVARLLVGIGRPLRRGELDAVPAAERAWLDVLRCEVLVPVIHDGTLAAVLSLGPKRSEAPYSDADVALLSAVAAKAASEIDRLSAGRVGAAEVEALRERQRQLDEDLRAAAEVQRSHMPASPPRFADLAFAWRFVPCEAVGGDLLQVQQLGERYVAFWMVDVSGHGVAAAMLSVSIAEHLAPGAGLLTEGREGRGEPRSPARVLESLDERYPIERSSKFFTIFYAVYDRRTRRLRYSRGGHPTPILVRADGSVGVLEEGGTIIGLGGLTPFEEGEVTVGVGDRLFVYTDGVTEYSNADDEMFGEARLRGTLVAERAETLDAECACVLHAAASFAAPAPALDDVTVFGVEFREEPAARIAPTADTTAAPAA